MVYSKKINNKFYLWFGYTIVFIVGCIGIFLPFIIEHKSLIWKADGLFQTFSSMVYISDYYKGILSGLLHGNFNPKMIDFHIGLGYDVFTTLNYYGLGDPLLLFSVFFNRDNMEIFYNGLVIVRLYLSGAVFLLYCNKMNKGQFQALIGAVIYVFCGFAIVTGERHPYFLNGMIYLPLLLIGVETILKKKKSYLFTIMIFVSVVSNYYFFYMLTMMVFIYALIRFIDIYRKEWKKNIINALTRGIIQYLLGIGLAGFALLPTIYAFLNNARGTSGTYDSGLVYSIAYYVKFIFGFFSAPTDINGNFTFLSYAPISLFVVLFLFVYKENRGKYIALKTGYALATVMLFTPVAGYIMNGMSYSSNRWIFGYSFLTAFVVVCLLEDFLQLSFVQLIPFLGVSVLLMIPVLVVNMLPERFSVWGVAYLLLMSIILILINKQKDPGVKYGVVLIINLMAVITFGYYKNADVGFNYVAEFREASKAISTIENCPQSSIDNNNELFYRVGSYGGDVENQSIVMGYNGTSSYYSLVDGNILQFMKDMEISSLRQPHRFYGLDQRTYLEALASVKYYAFEDKSLEEKNIPYGYQEISRDNRDNSQVSDVIYENQYTLPLGYTYDKKISTSYYDTLNSIEKQQALLQAVVVEDADNQSQEDMKYSEAKLDYTISETNGITWNKDTGKIKVNKSNSTLTLTFDAKKDCETYVRLKGLDVENADKSNFTATVTSENTETKLNLTNSKYRWDLERENYLVNLGHKNDGKTTCTIKLGCEGEFDLEDIEVYSLPMKDYEEQVTKLGEEALTDIKLSNNKITGSINVSKDKTLLFSVLYNAGWSLKVDGKVASLYKANTMYMATDITKGSHTIELTYQTPGIKAGQIISSLTLILLIGGVLTSHVLKRKKTIIY